MLWYIIMHKCTFLAIHDHTGIAKLLFVLTTNAVTDRDSVYPCIIYFIVSYLYISGVIIPAFMLLCMYCAFIRMLSFVRKWRNKTDQSINKWLKSLSGEPLSIKVPSQHNRNTRYKGKTVSTPCLSLWWESQHMERRHYISTGPGISIVKCRYQY